MEIHLKIIGFSLIVLALVHIIFPKYFNWREELKTLSLVNRQMMIVHTFFIALTVLLMGLLCILATSDLIYTDLGKMVCLGFSIFWFVRLLIQFFGYSSKLWRGKVFETIIHALFSLSWLYFSVVFFLAFNNQMT